MSPGVHTHRTSCERVRTRAGGSLRHSRGRLTPSAAGNDDPGQGICFFLLLLLPLPLLQVQLTGVVTARLALLATHQLSYRVRPRRPLVVYILPFGASGVGCNEAYAAASCSTRRTHVHMHTPSTCPAGPEVYS